jgi:hypothetical protein
MEDKHPKQLAVTAAIIIPNVKCSTENSPLPQSQKAIWVNHHNDRVKTIHRIETKTSVKFSGTFHQT